MANNTKRATITVFMLSWCGASSPRPLLKEMKSKQSWQNTHHQTVQILGTALTWLNQMSCVVMMRCWLSLLFLLHNIYTSLAFSGNVETSTDSWETPARGQNIFSVAKLQKKNHPSKLLLDFLNMLMTQSVSGKSENKQAACCGLKVLATYVAFKQNLLYDLFLVKSSTICTIGKARVFVF